MLPYMRPMNPNDRVHMGERQPHRATARSLVKEVDMAYYVILANFTDQGVRTIKDSPARFEAFKAVAEAAGINIKSVHWTTGAFDVVLVFSSLRISPAR